MQLDFEYTLQNGTNLFMNYRSVFLGLMVATLISLSCQNTSKDQATSMEYVCTPCELKCDELYFAEAGTCPHCHMKLVKKSDLDKKNYLSCWTTSIIP